MNAQHYSRETNWNTISPLKRKPSANPNREFTFLWNNGKRERIFCDSPQQAIVSLAISTRDIEQQMFKIVEGDSEGYYWCSQSKSWKHRELPEEAMVFQ